MAKTKEVRKRGKTLKPIDLPKKGEVLLFWNFIEQVHNNTQANNTQEQKEEETVTTKITKQQIQIRRRSINLRSRRIRL